MPKNTENRPSCAIYCRFSSKQQEGGYSIEAQKSAGIEYARTHNLKVYRIFEDHALSGTSDEREAFQNMIHLASGTPPPFTTIVVHKLDRFARNRYDSIKYKYLLRKKGVRVLSVTQPSVGSNDPTEVLLESLLEGMDEFYSLNLARESIKGMVENVKAGYWNGGRAPYGYKKLYSEDSGRRRAKLEIDPKEATIVEYIYKRYARGNIGLKGLVLDLNRKGWKPRSGSYFTKGHIEHLLLNEKYVGDTKFGKQINTAHRPIKALLEPVIVKNSHPAIVSRELADKVQRVLRSKSPENAEPRIHNDSYLLSGLIVCGKCGFRYVGVSAKSGKFFYYMCGTKNRKGKIACDAPILSRKLFENQVIEKLKKRIVTRENIRKLATDLFKLAKATSPDIEKKINRIEVDIRNRGAKLQRLYEVIETSKTLNADDLAPRIRELKADIDQLRLDKENKVSELNATKNAKMDIKWIDNYAQMLIDLIESHDFHTRKNFLLRFIKKITVKDNVCEISYIPFGNLTDIIPTQDKKKELRHPGKVTETAEFSQKKYWLPLMDSNHGPGD